MSTLKVDTIQNTSGVERFMVKAWVSWKSSGTATLLASGGVSSVLDTGVGAFGVNFADTFINSNYASSGMDGQDGVTTNNAAVSFNTGAGGNGNTTTSRSHSAEDVDGGYTDYNHITVIYVN